MIRFSPGRLVATPGALEAFKRAGVHPGVYLTRHLTGDWGELDDHDRQMNEEAVKHGDRILSAYSLSNGEQVWVITEADRAATTLLLPEEY